MTVDSRGVAGLEELGGFFAVAWHEPSTAVPTPWASMAELLDPAVLRARVEQVRSALGAQPDPDGRRVAASVAQLGLVARLIAPALGVAATHGRLLDLRLNRLRWQPVLGGPFPLSVSGFLPGASSAVPGRGIPKLAVDFHTHLLDGPIRQLSAGFELSDRVLWGNVASALHSAAAMIGAARPDLAPAADALLAGLRSGPALAGTGAPTAHGFRRNSCCLIYRLAGGAPDPAAVCGDCVLR
jgi:FhuF 2Fe-2S C-terminal domain